MNDDWKITTLITNPVDGYRENLFTTDVAVFLVVTKAVERRTIARKIRENPECLAIANGAVSGIRATSAYARCAGTSQSPQMTSPKGRHDQGPT